MVLQWEFEEMENIEKYVGEERFKKENSIWPKNFSMN
jgi:hypothetical protein